MIGHPNLKFISTDGTKNEISGAPLVTGGVISIGAGCIGQATFYNSVSALKTCVDTTVDIQGSTKSLTVAAWIKRTGVVPVSGISTVVLSGDTTTIFSLDLTPTLIRGVIRNASYTFFIVNISASVAPLNTWTHVAFTFDRATGVLLGYLNGVLTDTIQAVTPFTWVNYDAVKRTTIGNNYASLDRVFNGYIDNGMHIYHTCLPITDIKRIMLGKHPLTRS